MHMVNSTFFINEFLIIGYLLIGIFLVLKLYKYIDKNFYSKSYTRRIIDLLSFLFNIKNKNKNEQKSLKIRKTIFILSLYDSKRACFAIFPKIIMEFFLGLFFSFLTITWIISLPILFISFLIYYYVYVLYLYKHNKFYKEYLNSFLETYNKVIQKQIDIEEEKYNGWCEK